jgi:adenosylcobinamide-GDP ribazoletransferase
MPVPENLIADGLNGIRTSIAFLTRLPLGQSASGQNIDIAHASWAFPIAGIVVGLLGAVVYALAFRLGLGPWPSAALCVAATLGVTGCLHEDGLADTADGFGGGATRERKLEIMRDSRIGTYGVCALTLSILLRVAVIATLARLPFTFWALIAAHGAARAVLPIFMSIVPPARDDGLSHAAGQPPQQTALIAAALGVVILVVLLGPLAGIAALVLLAVIMTLMAWLSSAQIGGQTGDVLGALEQISEIAVLLVALH